MCALPKFSSGAWYRAPRICSSAKAPCPRPPPVPDALSRQCTARYIGRGCDVISMRLSAPHLIEAGRAMTAPRQERWGYDPGGGGGSGEAVASARTSQARGREPSGAWRLWKWERYSIHYCETTPLAVADLDFCSECGWSVMVYQCTKSEDGGHLRNTR